MDDLCLSDSHKLLSIFSLTTVHVKDFPNVQGLPCWVPQMSFLDEEQNKISVYFYVEYKTKY